MPQPEFSCEPPDGDGFIRIVCEGYTAGVVNKKGKIEWYRPGVTAADKERVKALVAEAWLKTNAPEVAPAAPAMGKCPDCGGPMKVIAGNQERCRDCASKKTAPGEHRAASKKHKVEESVMPKPKGGYKKVCEVCKMEFVATGARQIWCGDKCRAAAKATAQGKAPVAKAVPKGKEVVHRKREVPAIVTPAAARELPWGGGAIIIPLPGPITGMEGTLTFEGGAAFTGTLQKTAAGFDINGSLTLAR